MSATIYEGFPTKYKTDLLQPDWWHSSVQISVLCDYVNHRRGVKLLTCTLEGFLSECDKNKTK